MDQDPEEIIERLNVVVEELEAYPDTEVREKAIELSQMILALHGEVLRRILVAFDDLPEKEAVFSLITRDEVIRSVLLIHGLISASPETIAASAVEELRPSLLLRGCDIKFLNFIDGRMTLRLVRSGRGAPPVSELKLEIEKALVETVPGLLEIEIEGIAEQIEVTAKAAAALRSLIPNNDVAPVPRPVQITREAAVKEGETWIPVIRSLGFIDESFEVVSYADVNVLITKVNGSFYAFRNACPVNSQPLDTAVFESPNLLCSCHGYHYDVTHRGVCKERPEMRLRPLPVKVEEDKVKVAL